jgi:leader peptidase (prepilin peptidase)/N-methyltransferase
MALLPFPLGLLLFVLGASLGSFGNVLIARMPAELGIGGRSRCPRCGVQLAAWQLIPLVSFGLLRGRCAGCKERISLQYPLVELASAALFVGAGVHVGGDLLLAVLLGIALWLLLVISIIDARTARIPDALNLPIIVAALAYAIAHEAIPFSAVAVGTGFLGTQWIVSRGKWMGSGDVLLITGIAFLLPDWRAMIIALGVAYILGSLFACVLLLQRKKSHADTLAFGPFLAVGGMAAVFFGDAALAIFLQ